MKGFCERIVTSRRSSKSTSDTLDSSAKSVGSESESTDSKSSINTSWSSFFTPSFSLFETHSETSDSGKEVVHTRNNGWTAAVKRVMAGGAMRRFQELVLGPSKTGISSSSSDIWLLGECYKVSPDESSKEAAAENGLASFKQDFSSRILMTYRKGFEPIGESRYTSDVNWGCMIRSGQMLIAQALLFHQMGRSWRKSEEKPLEQDYIKVLQLFGDSEGSAFSIHNLISAGKAYGLAAGSWIGPYAMCRACESLSRPKGEKIDIDCRLLPMAVYVVSGCEDGERGGAPVLCIEDASKCCFEFSNGQADWTPILLLVPLVLGLEKVNPRYIPSLRATFTFPQSLGILGGKTSASTYIVGVQDENAFYLDPHEVQQVVDFSKDNLDIDTSSYHCNVIRYIPLESIDPSLALGFYCRDKDDFDALCVLASKLAEESNGAPLFTVAETHSLRKPVTYNYTVGDGSGVGDLDIGEANGSCEHEDEWQLL